MPVLRVNIPSAPHDMVIEPGALESLGQRTRSVAPHDRGFLAIDDKISDSHGRIARRSLAQAGYDVRELALRAAERDKSLDVVRTMYQAMLGHHLDRGSPVIAMGGGIIGDTAGFAAATFMRGLPLVQVPTTLLAMVDASIGGKTGVNLELPDAGLLKNQVGAFHQPRVILADPLVLGTLDPRDFACGLAESIKHGLIADPGLLEFISGRRHAIMARDPDVLAALIERSAGIKIAIVQRDEREGGERALLNLGHTFAHAIEAMPGNEWRHGEAVAIGLIAAAECGAALGVFPADDVPGLRRLVGDCGLPDRLGGACDGALLMRAMQHDKKLKQGRLRLVLPRSPGRCEMFDAVPTESIEAAWRAVGAL